MAVFFAMGGSTQTGLALELGVHPGRPQIAEAAALAPLSGRSLCSLNPTQEGPRSSFTGRRLMRKRFIRFAILGVALALAVPAGAQELRGRLVGTVSDATGARCSRASPSPRPARR